MLYIFDMGGVVTTTAEIEPRIAEILGITQDEFKKIASGEEENQNLFNLCSNGKIDTKQFWDEFSKRSGRNIQTDWFHYLFHPILNKKTVKLIKDLRKKGNRVVCGTNTISAHYANHLERGDYSFFDQTYASCFMGVSKPDTDFWKIILKAENVRAEDTIFIDDRKENCLSAATLGLHAIQFKSAEETKSQILKFEKSIYKKNKE